MVSKKRVLELLQQYRDESLHEGLEFDGLDREVFTEVLNDVLTYMDIVMVENDEVCTLSKKQSVFLFNLLEEVIEENNYGDMTHGHFDGCDDDEVRYGIHSVMDSIYRQYNKEV